MFILTAMGTIYRQDGRKNWMLKYYRGGVAIVESSGTDSYQEAERLLKTREGDIAKGLPIAARVNKLTVADAFKAVEVDYTNNRRRSIRVLRQRIRLHLLPFFGGVRRMTKITTPHVRQYTAERLEAGASHGEINRELAHLKRAFNLAIQDGVLFTKPHIPMLDESTNVREGFFERRDLTAVLGKLPEDLWGVARFAYVTGWRVDSEVLPLEWRRVDFNERLTPGQDPAGTVWLEIGQSKNKRARVFPMTRELRDVLLEQQRRREQLQVEGVICPWVFHRSWKHVKGKRIRSWRKAWNNACRGAGLQGRIPHDFRRTAVRNLVRAGVPERVAMRLTGHKTRSVFERYNIVSDADLSAAAQRLDRAEEVGVRRRDG